MLTIKLELDKNKENYQAVLAALSEFDIVSAAWDDVENTETKIAAKSGRSGEDLSSAISAAVNAFGNRRPRG